MLVFLIIIVAVFAFIMVRRSGSKPAAAPTQQYAQYSTTLRTGPNPSAPIVMCKDGAVYMGSRMIGTYKPATSLTNNWYVYNSDQIKIGHSWKNSTDDFTVDFSLDELCRAFNRPIPKDSSWAAAEVLNSHGCHSIIDRDTYEPILWYSGDPAEAAAAFICWAYTGYGNKYSDFFNG